MLSSCAALRYVAVRSKLVACRSHHTPSHASPGSSADTAAANATLHSTSLESKWKRLTANCKTAQDFADVLRHVPEVREAVRLLAQERLRTPVYIYHSDKPDVYVIVERRPLLDACTSIQALQSFMAGQLGIAEGKEVRAYWSDDSQPGGQQYELTEDSEMLAEAGSLPIIVGRADGWFLTEK